MVIGIDASRAFISERTGTENYSYHLITEMLRLPAAQKHAFVLFIRPNAIIPKELVGYTNVIVKTIEWRYLWTQLGLAWETWQNPPLDVLWVPAHTLPVLRNPRLKTVVTIHGLEYQWLPEYKNLLQRWYLPLSTFYAAKYADKLIAVSKYTAKQLEKELHTHSKKIKVVWEGVAIDVRREERDVRVGREKYGLQNKKYILFVGTIQPRKNLVALIKAFSQLHLRLRGDMAQTKLVIAGGVGWMAREVFEAVKVYGVTERVVFTGRISAADLEVMYRGAALYVQPSITEGFGLPILEAMQRGVPVVSSDGGALPEVVGGAGMIVKLGNGELGVTIQDGDDFADRLRSAMQKVLREPKLRGKLVAEGKKRVRDFSWVKAAKETLKVLLEAAY